MSVLDSMQGFLEKHVGPIAHKVSSFKVVKGLMSGMMATMPVTLGVALLSIINGLPIPPLQAFLASTGMSATITDVLVVTMNSAPSTCAPRSRTPTARCSGTKPYVDGCGYWRFAPADSSWPCRGRLDVYRDPLSGSSGLFVALLVALIVPKALNFLMKHIAIPMPDSVPQFVTDSLSPMFCAIVIFTTAALVKWGMGMTSFGDVFNLINSTIATPVMFLGSSPWAVVIYFTLCNLLFFFGIHPSVLMGVYMPVVQACALANTEAFVAGQPLPYLSFIIMFSVGSVDALGMELALLTAKSERYKALSKIALVPALFNISEPIIFGTPIAMNPYMFIPYILLKPVACIAAAVG